MKALVPARKLRLVAGLLAPGFLAAVLLPGPRARVDVTLDASSLQEILTGLTPETVPVDTGLGMRLSLRIRNLRVLGFDPAGAAGRGQVLAAAHIEVPEIGYSADVQPKLTLECPGAGPKVGRCFLRFRELPVPVLGRRLDLGPMLPPVVFPAENAWIAAGPKGPTKIRLRLVETRMGTRFLKVGFEIGVSPSNGAAASRR